MTYVAFESDIQYTLKDENNRAVLLAPYKNDNGTETLKLMLFDANKKKVVLRKKINLNSDEAIEKLVKYNNSEFLLITRNAYTGRSDKFLVFYKIKFDTFEIQKIGRFEVEQSEKVSCENISQNEVLLLGGGIGSKQAYIFKEGKFEKINNLNCSHYKPKILKISNDTLAIVGGGLSDRKINIEYFDRKTKTFKKVYENKFKQDIEHAFFAQGRIFVVLYNSESAKEDKTIVVIDAAGLKTIKTRTIECNEQIFYKPFKIFAQDYAQLKDGNILIFGGAVAPMWWADRGFIYDCNTLKITQIKSKIKFKYSECISCLLSGGGLLIVSSNENTYPKRYLQMYKN